jgi:hypothetical protein
MKSFDQEETDMITTSHRTASRLLPALLCLAGLLASGCSSTGGPEVFASPEDAVQELVRAASAADTERLLQVSGPEGQDLLVSGDEVADQQAYKRFLTRYDEKHSLEADGDDRRILVIGTEDWPFPVPIVREADGWVFDAAAGREEVLNRRIGGNELDAIQVCQAIADAQRDFALWDANGNGTPDYAQQFMSDPGERNGLYWATAEGEPQSPLGELVVAAAAEGYERKEEGPTPYHGYVYRILKAQGPAARGGALDYVVNGKMILGFGVVACPAEYGNSGIMTFIISAAGVVYQQDFGEDTARICADMKAYDPGPGWERAE